MGVGEEIHQSQKTLMKSFAHHSGERVGMVVIYDWTKVLTWTGQGRIGVGQGVIL